MSQVGEILLESIADQLATKDYAIIDDFLSPQEVENILNVFDIHREHGAFKQAAIGDSVHQEIT